MTDRPEDVKAHVRRRWDDRAPTFDDEVQHVIDGDERRERWRSVLAEWVGRGPGRVLDVGCGTGAISLLLAEVGFHVVGVDFAPRMLRRARAKAATVDERIDLVRGDAERLPLTANGFDAVTARHLIWTLPDPEAALREWRRVCKPGGRIALIEGHWDFDEPPDGYEEVHDALPLSQGRPPGELREIVAGVGLEAVEVGSLMDPVLWGREPEYERYLVVGAVTE